MAKEEEQAAAVVYGPKISVTLEPSLHEQAKAAAAADGISLMGWVRDLIVKAVSKQKRAA
jgi:predicted HicB family RNase H-like nuclease